MKTILIIDDFENTLQVTSLSLMAEGYKVIKAKNGKEALMLLQSQSVDLIITDYHMPKMNGLELIKEVKKNPINKNKPVFVLSTETSQKIKEHAYVLGVTAWIKKPFNLAQLRQLVLKAI